MDLQSNFQLLVIFSAKEFLNQSFLLNFTYFIIIRRKNHLRRIVSDKVARKENIWHIRTYKLNLNIVKKYLKTPQFNQLEKHSHI